MSFNAGANGQPSTITVTATDSYGCTNSATATTAVRTIPPPVLHVSPDSICAASGGSAWIDQPDPNNSWVSWINVQWSITNGTITRHSSDLMSFNAGANGQPSTITVTATDGYGCTNSAAAATVVRTIPPPAIHVHFDTVCAGGADDASVDPPDPYKSWITWTNVHCSITHGTNG